jgi:murein DD-endopeptidase MepM/ murein hydrolase activator NlpD
MREVNDSLTDREAHPEPLPGIEPTPPLRGLLSIWETTSSLGLADTVLRIGTHALLLALILIVAWGLREFYLYAGSVDNRSSAFASAFTTPTPASFPAKIPDFSQLSSAASGIPRFAKIHTDVPSRPREEVITYTVKEGDTLFGIADRFGLKPETILWSNQLVLADNPHSLRPEQELNILPVDGAYYRWSAGDGLNGVAKFFGVTVEEIINFPANQIDPQTIGDWTFPNIEPGKWLVIPGGRRAFVSWSAPAIPLDNPGVAKVLGPGACENVQSGVVGVGVFLWPVDNHFLSGYDYEPEANHPGVDIDGDEGSPVYATDNGVVVYAGWNNWGYGNVIVINHANGWQTLYAHLSAYYVGCGQFVYQGNTIGAVGSTGNSDGAHLHFEMMYNGVRVNPHDYLP